MPKVFIANKGSHDYKAAKKFGELVFLSEGELNKFAIGHLFRVFSDGLRDATEEDFFLPTSLPILSSLATGILVQKFGVVKYLLFRAGVYVVRTVNFKGDTAE